MHFLHFKNGISRIPHSHWQKAQSVQSSVDAYAAALYVRGSRKHGDAHVRWIEDRGASRRGAISRKRAEASAETGRDWSRLPSKRAGERGGEAKGSGVRAAVIQTAIASDLYEAASAIPCRAARKRVISVERTSSLW